MPVPGLPGGGGGLSFKGGDSRSATDGNAATGGINFAASQVNWVAVAAVTGAFALAAVVLRGK